MTDCAISSCDNDPRYIRADGAHTCAIHAIGSISIRLADVPRALLVLSAMLDELEGSTILPDDREELRGLIGRAG